MPTRSYTVGQQNTVLRRDAHIGPWIDIAPTSPQFAGVHWRDVMAFPGEPDKVVIIGSISAGVTPTGIAVSTDAGVTWNTPSGNWSTQGKLFHEVWIPGTAPGSMNVWVISEYGWFAKSTDGGLSFNNPQPFNNLSKPGGGALQSTNAIYAIDANTAVVAGSAGLNRAENEAFVWKTIDGGNSWITLNTGATYTLPVPPSLRNSQVTGLNNVVITSGGTGYAPTINGAATATSGSGLGATLNVTSTGGVIDAIAFETIGDGYTVGDTLIVVGGNSDCVLTVTAVGGGDPTGQPGGIWMSTDQQRIIVSTNYTQQLSIDGGNLFTPVPAASSRSGRHLTWYPSADGGSGAAYMRHTGGPTFHILSTSDQGASWTIERSSEGIIIQGAHFYSPQNGYYLVSNQIWDTSNGGITGDNNLYTDTQQLQLEAVWTESPPEQELPPCYQFTPCDEQVQPTMWTGAILTQYNGQVVDITFDSGTTNEITLCGTLNEILDPDICSQAIIFTPANTVNNAYVDCDTCLGPVDEYPCYNLVPCDNENCTVIRGATDPELTPLVGQYVEINGDDSCRYLVTQTRQGYFTSGLNPLILSNPASDFQLGIDDHTIQVTSVVVNGTEYVPGVATPYILTEFNYQVVECTGLSCVTVPINTTENCVTNLPLYLNNVFANSMVPDLSAECADPEYCEDLLNTFLTKIQYTEGTTFSITFTIQNNSGTLTYVYTGTSGNVTSVEIVNNNVIPPESINILTCNSQNECTGNSVIDIKQPINVFSECVTIPEPQLELGEACVIRPRFAEPGFSTKYCNPQKVVDINCKFGDSVYALFKRMRYGIQTCCEYDLDKIEIKKDLMDLGALYDPDMCIAGQPVPFGCCPQPCNVVVNVQIPMFTNCPEPTDVTATITGTIPAPPIPCLPPEPVSNFIFNTANASLVIESPCLQSFYEINIPATAFGVLYTTFDCEGLGTSQFSDPGGMLFTFCGGTLYPPTFSTLGSYVNLGACP
jgi:hypothetical protein